MTHSRVPIPGTEKAKAALILDFCGTLIDDNLVNHLLRVFDIDPGPFWTEVSFQDRPSDPGGMAYLIALAEAIELAEPGTGVGDLQAIARDVPIRPDAAEFIDDMRQFADSNGLDLTVGIATSAPECLVAATKIASHVDFIKGATISEWAGQILPVDPFRPDDKADFIRGLQSGTALPDLRPIPAESIIFLGDGYTDRPAFRQIQLQNGTAAIVYQAGCRRGFQNAWYHFSEAKVCDFIAPADFSVGGHLSNWLKEVIATQVSPRFAAQGLVS